MWTANSSDWLLFVSCQKGERGYQPNLQGLNCRLQWREEMLVKGNPLHSYKRFQALKCRSSKCLPPDGPKGVIFFSFSNTLSDSCSCLYDYSLKQRGRWIMVIHESQVTEALFTYSQIIVLILNVHKFCSVNSVINVINVFVFQNPLISWKKKQ